MGDADVVHHLNRAITGLGVDERSLVEVLAKSHHGHRASFRKGSPHIFSEDERSFERWNDEHIELLRHEFLRFKNAMVLWTMHPWERDARILKESLREGPPAYTVIVEVACTRTSEELLGARKAYHSLFDLSVEEDVAIHVEGCERKLLVALVSAYRYEGSKFKHEAAKSEAKDLINIIKDEGKNPTENEEVIRILTTRSKQHLKGVYDECKEISGYTIVEEVGEKNPILKATIECLCTPPTYFSKVLFDAKQTEADQRTKTSLTRVVVTRADVDMVEIKEEYSKMHGDSLAEKIEATANGNYKDFMLALIDRGK